MSFRVETERLLLRRRWIRRCEERRPESGFGHLALERREDGCVLGRVGFLAWSRATWDKGVLVELGDLYAVQR